MSRPPRRWTITRRATWPACARPVEAPMARLGSPGCHVDVCLRRGGEEAGRVESTSLPQPAAFEQLRRRENEILKSALQPPNDCCSATRVDSKAAKGESDTTQPSPLPITLCAMLSAQAIHAAEGPGCSTRRRKLPDLTAGGGAGRRASRDRLLLRGAALRGRRGELAAAALPLRAP